jgi:hypothetical protein
MQQEKEQNYWLEFNEKYGNSKRYFSKSPYFTARFKLRPFEQSVEFISSLENVPPGTPPERENDDIVSFSKNSRSRLIKMFSEVSLSAYSKIYWVTLTFHHDHPEDPSKLKRILDNYIKRLTRFDSELHYIWRLEWQKRGAPHFHFIILIKKNREHFREGWLLDAVKRNWLEVKKCSCKHCRQYAVKSEELCTYRKAVYYVSKYVGKVDESKIDGAIGRRWGVSRNLLRTHNEEVSIPFYKFIYLKKLLRDHFRSDKNKSDYIASTFKNPYSHYLFCEFSVLSDLFHTLMNTSSATIFHSLRSEKLIPPDIIYDEDQIRIETALDAYRHQEQLDS